MTVDAILDEFDKWAADSGTRVDRAEVEAALELSRAYLEHEDPADLEPGDVDALLMDAYPREVDLGTVADAVTVVRTVRELLVFLGATGRLPVDRARALRDELEDVEADF